MKCGLIILLGCLALLVVPTVARADDYAVELPDGALYVYDGSSSVYRHVPDADTAFSLGVGWCDTDWCGVVHYDSTDQFSVPVGPDWPSVDAPSCGDPDLVELPGGAVYMLDNDGAYHSIPDPDTAVAMGVSWGGSDWNDVTHCDSVPGSVGDPYPSLDAGDGGTSYEYTTSSRRYCVSGLMSQEGLYTGTLPDYDFNSFYQIKVKITNANFVGFQGSAQLWFRYPRGVHTEVDLHLLPYDSTTFTSWIGVTPARVSNGVYPFRIPFQIWLSSDSDAVGLEYQACL